MEWISKNWAVIAGLGTAATWVWAAWHQALTLRRQQDQLEWKRIQELVTIIGNEQGAIGTWEQIAAVMELGALGSKRKYVVSVLSRLQEARERRAGMIREDDPLR